MIRRLILWCVGRRDLILEVERLKVELELAVIRNQADKIKAELSQEALTVQREWLQAIAAVARFEYAQHQTGADALKAGAK